MSVDDTQAEILRFLEGGGLGEPVERIDTHGAFVLLGRALAWKMKRAVRFSFMDFSTLAKREAAVRAELALNRRTAPALYRAVLPVTREANGHLVLGGAGRPVEWLLEMRRFPAEAQLDRVAARGELTDGVAQRLADVVAHFHDRAELRLQAGGAAAMREVVDGNAADLAGLAPGVLAPDAVAALARATAAELARRSGLLDRRRAEGKVRRCHGDLHLANIVLLDGEPVLFDCLEFSEVLASVDVLYDLAFLVMDLAERGLRERSWRVLQTYGEHRVEGEGLTLLRLFLSIRASIRAKVAGFTARGTGDSRVREERRRQAAAYLDLGRATLEPVPPVLVAIGGRSGTGKSTLAVALAPGSTARPRCSRRSVPWSATRSTAARMSVGRSNARPPRRAPLPGLLAGGPGGCARGASGRARGRRLRRRPGSRACATGARARRRGGLVSHPGGPPARRTGRGRLAPAGRGARGREALVHVQGGLLCERMKERAAIVIAQAIALSIPRINVVHDVASGSVPQMLPRQPVSHR